MELSAQDIIEKIIFKDINDEEELNNNIQGDAALDWEGFSNQLLSIAPYVTCFGVRAPAQL